MRMLDDDGELIPPGTFLQIAERFDLVQEIDRWVARSALELIAEHADERPAADRQPLRPHADRRPDAADLEEEIARTGADPAA